ncbi:DUF1178 family protein [Variovorax sp. ZT4R33]|uniref:DUF1178 family protein n=1 Tax=Variovorax sp. ZT4R33 TaxID=3443743 RepID=UPI003F47FEE3
MKVLDLQCTHGHGFEGWFASNDAFDEQLAAGLVECPVCADTAIVKRLSAPRLNLSGARAPESVAAPVAAAAAADSPQARWMRAMRDVIAKTEDVGDRFADEARRMHYGETAERGIRGQATREEAVALIEEGVPVLPLPMPAALKETLQ